jgi:Domain of unknown function (DUF4173)
MKASARNTLIAALIIGLDGDRLLRGDALRLGFALWVTSIVICTLVVGGRGTTERRLVLGGITVAAFGLVWRDSEMLNVIDTLSVMTMGAVGVWIGSGRRIAELTIPESVRAGALAALNTLGGAPHVIGDAVSNRSGAGNGKGTAGALVVGSVLAVPPLIVVAALLASSDKVFDRMLSTFANGIMSDGLQHLTVILVLAWLAAGWMRATLGDAIGAKVPVPASPRLPFLSISVGLYALIALLGTFIAVQARVLFGGAAFLRETEGLTVATYARDGFFQLILAAGVVLVTLVMAEWFMTDEDDAARRRYRTAATVLLAMVATLLVSSAVRIGLYVNEFGMSVDRMLAVSGIVWVFAALATFASTTLRGEAGKFMPVTLLVTVAWVALVNLTNPEAIVVRVNLARAERGETFDAAYHGKLSADALPALRAGASRLPAPQCLALEAEIRNRFSLRFGSAGDANGDWRGRNLPLWRAEAWLKSGQGVCSGPAPRPRGPQTG